MQTEKITREYTIANDENHLKQWLESEYPRGIDLYYVDYSDSLDGNTQAIMEFVREGYSQTLDESIFDYDLSYVWEEIERNYLHSLGGDVDELSDDLRDFIREWCYEHDNSNYAKDLLRNTDRQLLFIDTGIEAYENCENLAELKRRFGKTEAQKHAIEWITKEQMYHSTISFYFYVDIADVVEAVHLTDGEYITIDGAMIGNVTRGNGSNWLSDDDVFKLVIPKKAFIENVYADKEEGTGYGWHSICGDWNRDGAEVNSSKTKKHGYLYIEGETSLAQLQEREYDKKWKETGTCTFGDMNINRHKDTPYENNVPCGNRCTACGTFWID